MSRMLSFWFLVGVIVVLCVIFYRVMAGFLVPLFLAALLVVIFGPLHRWILRKCNGRQRIAAALTTVSVMLAVLLPVALLTLFAALEGRDLISRIDAASLKQKAQQLRTVLDLNIEHQTELTSIEEHLSALTNRFDVEKPGIQKLKLQEIIRASNHLADLTGLPPINQAASEELSEGSTLFGSQSMRIEQSWSQYASKLMQANMIINDTDWQQASADDIQTAQFELQKSLVATSNSFLDFRTEVLGGRMRAWAKDLANPTSEEMDRYADSIKTFIQKHILSVGGATTAFIVKIIVGAAIMMISLFFFLLDGPRMIAAVKFLSPLEDQHEQELLDEFNRVSRAVVLATLLSAIAQGLLAGIGFYFAGLQSVFLLMLLTTAMALIPFVGAAAVWIPASLWLYFVDGRLGAAIVLAIYGTAIISMVDNLIKPLVLHGQSHLHPLLALLSVLGGVSALGPIGILVGPMVVVFLQTLLKILQRELTAMDQERIGKSEAPTENATA